MHRSRLFAVAVSAALLLGAASAPAFAKSDNGKGKGQDKTKPVKPAPKPKKSKAGINGGGATTGVGAAAGEFSIQARVARLGKGHFNYTSTDESFKLRCRGIDSYTPDPANAKAVTVVSDSCVATTGPEGARTSQAVTVTATFTDNGQPAEPVPPATAAPGPDTVHFTVTDATPATVLEVNSPVTGNVKVR